MGRFIHFAFAATQEAIAQSGLQITEENADRVGVFIGSGIGGFEIIERGAHQPAAGRAAQDFTLLHSRRHRQHGCRPGEHSLWRQRADFGHGHSLRHIGQRPSATPCA